MEFGLYKSNVMFFSLYNSLATLQAYMNCTFQQELNKGIAPNENQTYIEEQPRLQPKGTIFFPLAKKSIVIATKLEKALIHKAHDDVMDNYDTDDEDSTHIQICLKAPYIISGLSFAHTV
ncbi:hypothetical protein BDR07DRAFT_1480159 [Suillus spraguei]|nr:hypothetical protein BDR07DRAFT_1480159 [Suillus spraguei]